MKITLGENIRRLRLEKGMTQEQLAEVLTVSPQAVSRWEMGHALPDITLLMAISIYFDMSVDALLGMDALRREDALWQIHTQVNHFMEAGRVDDAANLLRESLRMYPGDMGLCMSLAETLSRSNRPEDAKEAVALSEIVLENSTLSMKARATTTVNLLFLCMRTGEEQKAKALVRTLPHIWESREMLLPETEEKDYDGALKCAILKALTYLCDQIEHAPMHKKGLTPAYVQLGVDFDKSRTADEMLSALRMYLIN